MSLILLDAELIQSYISFADQLKIDIFDSIDSTNTYLKQRKSEKKFHACLAELQTAGRGRFSRTWFSPFGANIYLSLAWYTHKLLHDLGGLSLMMGLATVQALTELGIQNGLMIKWPNDILWRGNKLAGILIEVNAESGKPSQIIMGIGLNVNMPESWASINHILAADQDRNKIVGLLLNHIVHSIDEFNEQGFSESFIQQWKPYDFLFGKPLSLKAGHHIINGIAMGVNSLGHLLLQHENAEIRAYASGDVTTDLNLIID
jgi:BirA family transcriptional regulator, biotin operon repressor / biotin---[acetyl-CoA-carboxylase] ligase